MPRLQGISPSNPMAYQVTLVLMCWAAGWGTPPLQAQEGLQRFEFRSLQMGVQARLVLYAAEAGPAAQAAAAAFQRIAALEDILSDYRPASELSRLTIQVPGTPVAVSPELFMVLDRAQRLARQSGGAFDVTAGPVVAVWRQARRTGRLPEDSSAEAARRLVGWQGLILDTIARTVTPARSGMRLDAGGIAKGYAGDEALRTLAKHGVTRALVELGGDIVVGDAPPGTEGWPIAVETGDGTPRIEHCQQVAISTSGDAEQFLELGGRRYSHVIDPRTGQALTSGVAVTVVARDGLTADGLATLLSVLGPDAGAAFLARYYPGVLAWIKSAGTASGAPGTSSAPPPGPAW